MSIFISLNSKNKDEALVLQKTLLKWGYANVWTMDDIRGGEDWTKKIRDELSKASICLLAISKDGVTFAQGYEAGIAFGMGLRVIPVLYSGGTKEMIPDIIKHLHFRKIEDISNSKSVLESCLMHDLHPYFVAPKARSLVVGLTDLTLYMTKVRES